MTSPADARELLAQALFNDDWRGEADWLELRAGEREQYLARADAVLAAGSPVIRQQVYSEMKEKMHSFHHEDQIKYGPAAGATRYVNIHHNGDYSGDVAINVGVQKIGRSVHDVKFAEIEIPFAAIKSLVAEYVRQVKIGKLEDASNDQLLADGEAELAQQ